MDIGSLALGIDIGSTTVKCVLLSEEHKQPIYQAYLSHETLQALQTGFALVGFRGVDRLCGLEVYAPLTAART